ncbi:iron-containing alcohol dehydrogenase [Agrobacterium sp. B1(2019)]|uniref:iron-containing alcohol dehydrogenase n=1 Tax=Agrobacterium sp. B1(2019) TaxID=2607032 RepID=UPI0011EC5E6F|nr:iron-containing alcohol dehydrogenase [Agrobacterium sp. B1(2019)]TZG36548.1 iron-containing alcohol dehydrogenase [Agrobacterium sp. B1(2019)]
MSEIRFLPQSSVIWGKDVVAPALRQVRDQFTQKPMLFSIPELVDVLEETVAPGLGETCSRYLDFPPHVPDFAVEAALDAAKSAGAGLIVACGGGSVLDAAKAVSHAHHLETGSFLPIVALPTTLSGSEFSHYFGITETSGGTRFKRSYAVRDTTPRHVIIDPELMRRTPRPLLLSSAIKGLDHALEGMRKVGTEHPHAILAAQGVRTFLSVLGNWPEQLETEDALAKGLVTLDDILALQLSAWHCYFYPASVVYGLSHRIGHILGGTFELPHSMTSCVTLAPVMSATSAFYGSKLRPFAPEAHAAAPGEYLARIIAQTVKHLGLPSTLSDLRLAREALPEVASLLQENYPDEVRDLGPGAEEKLPPLLEAMW